MTIRYLLSILTSRDSFDFSRSVLGTPPKNTRETQTNLIVKNGETIVIGGIYTEEGSDSEAGVPLLSKIPLLGWLFKKETKTKDKTELLIFITPYIKNRRDLITRAIRIIFRVNLNVKKSESVFVFTDRPFGKRGY